MNQCYYLNNKKLCYRRRTARRAESVKFSLTAASLREQSCTAYPEQIRVMELEGYSRPTCNKLRVDCRRCDPQARPSKSFVDNTIDSQWRNFLIPEFRARFQRDASLFRRYPNILTTQWSKEELPCLNQLHSFIRFDRTPTCRGHGRTRTRTHRATANTRASIASHDKNARASEELRTELVNHMALWLSQITL